MKNQFLKVIFSSLVLAISGCAMLQAKIDPAQSHTTDGGFRFQFSMPGEWYPGKDAPGQYTAGQKPLPDGTTKLAVVRHGPIWTPGGKPLTNSEMLDGFKKDLEKEAQGGRVANIKSAFSKKKYKNADCLYFEQTGQDKAGQAPMDMNNDGVICLHPKRKAQFIWLTVSERRPAGKPVSAAFGEDKNLLFNSLEFLD